MVILDRTPAAGPGVASSPLRSSSPRETASPPSEPILPYLRSISSAMGHSVMQKL